MDNQAFFKHWLGVSAEVYLAAHSKQALGPATVLADVAARRPGRAELLILAADVISAELKLELSGQDRGAELVSVAALSEADRALVQRFIARLQQDPETGVELGRQDRAQ